MIVSMLSFEILIMALLVHVFDTLPSWARIICLITWITIHVIACSSEENLRKEVKSLKKEVKKIKKGGTDDV